MQGRRRGRERRGREGGGKGGRFPPSVPPKGYWSTAQEVFEYLLRGTGGEEGGRGKENTRGTRIRETARIIYNNVYSDAYPTMLTNLTVLLSSACMQCGRVESKYMLSPCSKTMQ